MTSKIIKECGTCWEYDIPAGYCGLKEQNGWLWDDVCDSWTWTSPRGRPTKEEYAESKRVYEKLTGQGPKPVWFRGLWGHVCLTLNNSRTKRRPVTDAVKILKKRYHREPLKLNLSKEQYKRMAEEEEGYDVTAGPLTITLPEAVERGKSPLASFVPKWLQKRIRARLERQNKYDKNGMYK